MYPEAISFMHIPPVKTVTIPSRITRDMPATTEISGSFPQINLLETAEDYLLLIGTPGVSREELYVTIEDGIITISTNRKNNPNNPVCLLKECYLNDFPDWTRAIKLPEDADAKRADATYKNGELYIHIPRGLPGENKGSSEVYVY
jgi:HSP20 family protein